MIYTVLACRLQIDADPDRFLTLVRIRILPFNSMRIHANPKPGPQHCISEQKRYEIFVINAQLRELRVLFAVSSSRSGFLHPDFPPVLESSMSTQHQCWSITNLSQKEIQGIRYEY